AAARRARPARLQSRPGARRRPFGSRLLPPPLPQGRLVRRALRRRGDRGREEARLTPAPRAPRGVATIGEHNLAPGRYPLREVIFVRYSSGFAPTCSPVRQQ